jgi:hypothetical protein
MHACRLLAVVRLSRRSEPGFPDTYILMYGKLLKGFRAVPASADRYTLMRYTPMRCTPEVHAHEVHTCEMHVCDVQAYEIGACEVHTYEMHAYEEACP